MKNKKQVKLRTWKRYFQTKDSWCFNFHNDRIL